MTLTGVRWQLRLPSSFAEEEQQYLTFVLGYDLLRERFLRAGIVECDLVYEECRKICQQFLELWESFDVEKPMYEILQQFVESTEKFDFEMDVLEAGLDLFIEIIKKY